MKRFADQTLYEILEVGADAAATDIERAYERARTLYGPGSLATYTLMSPEDASVLVRRIEEARSVLLDPAARAQYDASLAVSRPAAAPANGAYAAGSNGAAGLAPWSDALPPVIPALVPPVPAGPEEGDEPPAPVEAATPVEAAVPVALVPPGENVPPPIEVVPAAQPQAPEPIVAPPPAEPPPPAPAILLSQAAAAVGPPAPIPPAPPRPPILLDRQVGAPAPASPGTTDLVIPDGAAWSGDVLRRVREARGISIAQISERTKVTRHHIENIEGERFGQLPAAVYLRGILLALARELRLDGQKVARSYLERIAAGGAPPGDPSKR